MDISYIALTYLLVSAFIVGFSKTSVGGLGIIVVLLMALVFQGKESVGLLLPMLVVADLIAVVIYKKDCDWRIIAKIFPLTAIGVFIGYFIIDLISQEIFNVALGVVILCMLILGQILEWKKFEARDNKYLTVLIGLLAGIATMVANAAGPLLAIYFLQLALPKEKFVGTRSWYFLLLNVFKLPFSANLGLITYESLKLNLISLPFIILGAYIGVKFLASINMSTFSVLIKIASLIACVKLILF